MIYFICPNDPTPCGGVRKIYQHVDILNQHERQACVLHDGEGFRCSWFKNDTKIKNIKDAALSPSDFLVFPEILSHLATILEPGVKKIIFNQNAYLTFRGHTLDNINASLPYHHPDVLATITVSEDSRRYLSHAFPKHPVLRVRCSIDHTLFYPLPKKKPIISFMPRKNASDILQVLGILAVRGALDGFQLIPIEDLTHEQTAAVIRESSIFLSFSSAEGFGLPPAEAMASGCITIGYHGHGGKEFFLPEFSFPIEPGDIQGYARTAEMVLDEYRKDPTLLLDKGITASKFIHRNYSLANEEADILRCWDQITSPESVNA